MAIPSHQLESMLQQRFPGADICLQDLAGDQDHFCLEIVSEHFSGKSLVQRHQMVYKALDGCVGRELHALSMKTLTPQEAEALVQEKQR